METATFIRDINPGARQTQRLYKVYPPTYYDEGIDGIRRETQHVVVSAVDAMFSGPETYIFPADEDGKVLDWCELDGSFRGALNHDAALINAGYTPVYPDTKEN